MVGAHDQLRAGRGLQGTAADHRWAAVVAGLEDAVDRQHGPAIDGQRIVAGDVQGGQRLRPLPGHRASHLRVGRHWQTGAAHAGGSRASVAGVVQRADISPRRVHECVTAPTKEAALIQKARRLPGEQDAVRGAVRPVGDDKVPRRACRAGSHGGKGQETVPAVVGGLHRPLTGAERQRPHVLVQPAGFTDHKIPRAAKGQRRPGHRSPGRIQRAADLERAAVDRHRATEDVRPIEDRRAREFFGQAAGAEGHRAIDGDVPRAAHAEVLVKRDHRAGIAQGQRSGIGRDACGPGEGDRAAKGIRPADAPQRAIVIAGPPVSGVGAAGAVEGQSLRAHRDSALELERAAARHGRARGGVAQRGGVLDVQHAAAGDRRIARVAVAPGQRPPAAIQAERGKVCPRAVPRPSRSMFRGSRPDWRASWPEPRWKCRWSRRW